MAGFGSNCQSAAGWSVEGLLLADWFKILEYLVAC